MKKKLTLKPVDEVFANFLTPEEMKETDAQADREMLVLKGLQEDISKFAVSIMAEEDLGFRAFAREHELSLSMASKVIKGTGNLTLETISHIAALHKMKARLVFENIE